jgi:hypothetical protein
MTNQTRMVFDLETSTAMSIADGEYELVATMNDYRTDDWNPTEWTSALSVKVVDGKWDEESVLNASENIMDACGYWGVFVEELEYNFDKGNVELTVGS